MKVLLHACCGPCAIVPVRQLKAEGADLHGVYVNPNVHPYTEWERRRQALVAFSQTEGLSLLPSVAYDPTAWFRGVAFREAERCRICYHLRLLEVAHRARRGKFEAFTSTLLYSVRQKHELIREVAQAVSAEVGVPFLYRDWRGGWKEGIERSKALGLYRQQYCGCLFSEQERFGGAGVRAK